MKVFLESNLLNSFQLEKAKEKQNWSA